MSRTLLAAGLLLAALAARADGPAFPARAELTEVVGFRTAPKLDDKNVIRYLPAHTKVKLLDSKPAFGSEGAFCHAEAMGRRGYIRCDKPSIFSFAGAPAAAPAPAADPGDSASAPSAPAPAFNGTKPPTEVFSFPDGGVKHLTCRVKGSAIKHYFFRGMLRVDSDGAPTCYHPGYRCDPADGVGWKGKPFSCGYLRKQATCAKHSDCTWTGGKCKGTIKSGQCVHEPNGDAQALDYLANGGAPGNFYGLTQNPNDPHMNGDEHAPCVQKAGDPAPGFYVSGSALVGPHKGGACDPRQFVDSSRINYVAMPAGAGGLGKGDIIVVGNWATGKIAFAIFADVGGKPNGMGEGSVALAKTLGAPSNPKGSSGADAHGAYLAFPGSAAKVGLQAGHITSWPPDQAKIDAEGKKLLDAWGGEAQFRALTEGLPIENPSRQAKVPCPQ